MQREPVKSQDAAIAIMVCNSNGPIIDGIVKKAIVESSILAHFIGAAKIHFETNL